MACSSFIEQLQNSFRSKNHYFQTEDILHKKIHSKITENSLDDNIVTKICTENDGNVAIKTENLINVSLNEKITMLPTKDNSSRNLQNHFNSSSHEHSHVLNGYNGNDSPNSRFCVSKVNSDNLINSNSSDIHVLLNDCNPTSNNCPEIKIENCDENSFEITTNESDFNIIENNEHIPQEIIPVTSTYCLKSVNVIVPRLNLSNWNLSWDSNNTRNSKCKSNVNYNIEDDESDDYEEDDGSDDDFIIESSNRKKKRKDVNKNNNQSSQKTKDCSKSVSSNQKEGWCCPICKMDFARKIMYEEHMNVHSGNRPFACKICNSTFRKREDINVHLRTVHSDKQYVCTMCNYVAKYKGKLTEHTKSVHEKPFVCDICNYRAGEKKKVLVHIVTKHNMDFKPYICEICGSSFVTKTYLSSHRRNVHFPQPKVCQTCGVLFPSTSKYCAHLNRCRKKNSDERYLCAICGTSYSTKICLKDHMNKHLNIRPYSCNLCDKKFFLRIRLDTHKFVHRGPAFSCEICNKMFNRKDNMKIHMKRHFVKSEEM